MKVMLNRNCAIAAAALLLSLPILGENSPPGLVNFGKFTKPTNGELVEINLSSDTIAIALQLAGLKQPELADAFGGLHSIRVSVVGLDEQNREEVTGRIKSVRAELNAGGWQQIVSVQEKREDVGIFLKSKGREALEGLVVTVLDGRKEAVFINIAGEVRMDKIGALAEKLNLGVLKKAAEALMKQATAPKE